MKITPYPVGTRVVLTEDAVDNYGEEYRGLILIVESYATMYMHPTEFFSLGKPVGYHPGYDSDIGEPLYDVEGFSGSLYHYEMEEC